MTTILALTLERDAGCSLFYDDEIKYASSEERFTRIKADEGYPSNSINNALTFANLKPKDLDKIVIGGIQLSLIPVLLRIYSSFTVKDQLKSMKDYWYPLLVKGESLNLMDVFKEKIDLDRFPFNQPFAKEIDFTQIEYPVSKDNVKTVSEFWKKAIVAHLDIDESKIIHIEHDSCHAAYALYGSPIREDNTIIFTADAWGDDLSATISLFDKKSEKIKRIKEYNHKNFQLARIYRYTTLYLRMLPNSHEYKVMGLAPYYTGPAIQDIEEILEHMQTIDGLEFKFNKNIPDIFDHLQNNLKNFRFDHIAAGLQSFTEKKLTEWIRNAVIEFDAQNVVFSGGISNNVKANMKIYQIPEIKNFFVCGSGGDESLPMGACYAYAESLGIKPKPLQSLYLGSNSSYIEKDLLIFSKYNIIPFTNTDQILDRLLCGKIIAVCRNRMEMGQRALGNRSIISDPRNKENIQKINRMIKNRDFWMPFAPVVLSEYQDKLIENPKKIQSPYMTIAFATKNGDVQIPAAIHQYDKTCRPEILHKNLNPVFWELIKKFFDKTGIPALLNTSFNLHGEPIVNNIEDALHVFQNSDLDTLWLNDHIIEKI